MASISITQKKVNKGTEQPVYVRFNHVKDWWIPTGYTVSPINFKNGKIIGLANAPEANDSITAIVQRLDKALRDVIAAKLDPSIDAIKERYNNQPVLKQKIENLFEYWNEEGKEKLEILQHELDVLTDAVKAKQHEIQVLEAQLGVNQAPKGLVKLIELFIEARSKTDEEKQSVIVKTKRNKKDKESKLAPNTINAYKTFLNVVKSWNADILITAVTKATFKSFEKHCIKLEYYNNSTHLMMQKFASIMAYYQKDYKLSEDYKNYSFDLPLKEENVIYLSSEELKAFYNVQISNWNSATVKKYELVKDYAVLMSLTGFRLQDAQLSKGDIQNGFIVKRQSKTSGLVRIPYTDRMKAICEKYNFKMKTGNVGYWNTAFRNMLKDTNLPSLLEDVTVVNYIGHKRIELTQAKYLHCTAHSLRRTMINQCLLRGMRYDQITLLTGHKSFEVFQTYIDRHTDIERLDAAFDFLDDVVFEQPLMKVA